MSSSILQLEAGPQSIAPKRKRGRPPLTQKELAERAERARAAAAAEAVAASTNPVEQARAAFHSGNRLSALVGLVLGGFVPLASYTLVHLEVKTRPQLWALVAGGLVYSAISVYGWAAQAFENRIKAAGFVVLLEGTLTFCSITWLSLAGLAILMVLNGVTAAVILQKPRAPSE